MVVAPKYPLEHAHSGDENPFDIVDSAWGSIERWRAQALQTGELGAMSVINKHIRQDFIARMDAVEEREAKCTAREEACDARERAHAVSVSNFVDFVGKASVLFDRLHKLRDDQEQQQQHEHLSKLLGDPSDPSKDPEPSLALEDQEQPAHGDPPGDPRGQFLRLNETDAHALRHVGKDEAEFPTGEQPRPPVVQQPIAAGLDDGD